MVAYNTKTRSNPKSYAVTGTIGKVAQKAWTIKQQISALEEQLSPLKDRLAKHFVRVKITRIDSGVAQVQWKKRNNWTYSASLQNEMLRIQQLQLAEQMDGTAVNNPTHSVAITTAKLAATK